MSRYAATIAAIYFLHLTLALPMSAERGERRDRRGPPPEAIEVCEGASSDDECSFVTPRGHEVEGTCLEMREGLVCVPERGPRPPRDGDDATQDTPDVQLGR